MGEPILFKLGTNGKYIFGVCEVAEFKFDLDVKFLASPCRPIKINHGIFWVNLYFLSLGPMFKHIFGVFEVAEFKSDIDLKFLACPCRPININYGIFG